MTTAMTSEDRYPPRRCERCGPTLLTLTFLALIAPAALAAEGHDGGEGLWGETDDKVDHQRGLLPDRVLPAVRARDEHDPCGGWTSARTAARPPRRRAQRPRRPARRLVATPVLYERRGAAALITIDRPERRNAVDGPTAAALLEAFERFCADDDAARAGAHRRRRAGVLRRRRPEGDRHARPRPPGGPLGFTRLDLAEADDRRRLRLVPGRRLRARAVVRPARRHRGRHVRLRRAPLGRPADRRRHAAAARGSPGRAARSTSC